MLLQSVINSGRIVDILLVGILIEIVVVHVYRLRTGGGVALASMIRNAGAGASLLLALRGALTGTGWLWIAACLLAALIFHVADLRQRWETSR